MRRTRSSAKARKNEKLLLTTFRFPFQFWIVWSIHR
jgi:hypothetical protein